MTECRAEASDVLVSRDCSTWRSVLLRREIVSICLFIFTADVIIGMINPTLSLFARSLGASLALVGALAAVVGMGRLISSLVAGTISDRRGRKGVLMAGMFCLAIASLLYTLVVTPYPLLLIHAILGIGFVSTLTIGFAYATDVVLSRERSLAIGLAATSMGLGFATGSLVGGMVAATWGYRVNYRVAMLIAVVGFFIAWRGVPRERSRTALEVENQFSLRRGLGAMIASPIILAVCLGSVLSNLIFGGLVVAFFPIYAHSLGISQATIGLMFATRALASTLARLPAGALGTIWPGHRIMLTALVMATIAAFLLPQVVHPAILMLFLIGEGIAYGMFLTSGQATIVGQAGEANRGAALGLYMAAASAADSIAPLFLGMIADELGVNSVFYIVGSLATVGVIVLVRIFTRHPVSSG